MPSMACFPAAPSSHTPKSARGQHAAAHEIVHRKIERAVGAGFQSIIFLAGNSNRRGDRQAVAHDHAFALDIGDDGSVLGVTDFLGKKRHCE